MLEVDRVHVFGTILLLFRARVRVKLRARVRVMGLGVFQSVRSTATNFVLVNGRSPMYP